uniref:Chitin-binding type-2 domain-containing protein n=1 Tax=Ditylenchus dipsaci TaxID=166011 RepID=A0A915E7S7_9BILA
MWATAFNRLHALLFLIAVQPSLCNAVYLGCPAYSQKDYPRGRLHYFVPNNCSEEFVSCVNDRPPATFKCDSGMVFDLSNNTCVLQKDCESSGDPQPTTSTWTNASSNASSCDGDFVWDLRLKLCFDEDCGADAHQPKP